MARAIADNIVALDDQRIATRSFAPGQRVYDEDLLTIDGAEYRSWNPSRSKLGSYIVKGGRNFPLTEKSTVLYLGAANGTTPSHVSDIVSKGTLVAVEFSFRSFRDLLRVSAPRSNMVPILADAWRPELYERYLGKVDFVFQDISQRQQAQIFAKNVNRFRPPSAMVAVKARSVNVAADPRDVYRQVAADIESLTDYHVVETIDLGPFEKDHAAIVIAPGKAAPQRDERPAPRENFERRDREERPRFERRDDRPREDRPPQQYRDERPAPRGPPPPRTFGSGAPSGGGAGSDRPKFGPKGGKPNWERKDKDSSGGERGSGDKPKRSGSEWKSKPDRRGWR